MSKISKDEHEQSMQLIMSEIFECLEKISDKKEIPIGSLMDALLTILARLYVRAVINNGMPIDYILETIDKWKSKICQITQKALDKKKDFKDER